MTLSLSCVQVFDHVWYYLPACRWHWCSFLGKGITIIQLTFYIIILCKLIYYPSPLSEVQTICKFFLTRENNSKLGLGERNQWTLNLLYDIFVYFSCYGTLIKLYLTTVLIISSRLRKVSLKILNKIMWNI